MTNWPKWEIKNFQDFRLQKIESNRNEKYFEWKRGLKQGRVWETDHIAARNSELRNSRSELSASFKGLSPCEAEVTVHNRKFVSVDYGGSLQEAYRSKRDVVGWAPHSTLHGHGRSRRWCFRLWFWLRRRRH